MVLTPAAAAAAAAPPPPLLLLLLISSLGSTSATSPAAPAPKVTDIHVVFSNHLDVGFNERSWNMSPSERCEGLFSPDGERCMPLAANVTSEYFNVYFPRAAAMASAARARGGDRYIYMAQPWVISLFLDCAGSGVNDWRPGHTSDALLSCPNASTVSVASGGAVKSNSRAPVYQFFLILVIPKEVYRVVHK
jgi:hypothetical protein